MRIYSLVNKTDKAILVIWYNGFQGVIRFMRRCEFKISNQYFGITFKRFLLKIIWCVRWKIIHTWGNSQVLKILVPYTQIEPKKKKKISALSLSQNESHLKYDYMCSMSANVANKTNIKLMESPIIGLLSLS